MDVGIKVSQPHHFPSLVISQVWLSPGQQEAVGNQTPFPLTSWLCWSAHCGPDASGTQSNGRSDMDDEGHSVFVGHILSACCIEGMGCKLSH